MRSPRYSHTFLLSADIQKEGRNFMLAEKDAGGILLGEWRLRAAKKLLEEGITGKIVVVGYRDETHRDVSRAEVIRNMLVVEYQLNPDSIDAFTQNAPGTLGNVQAIMEYVSKYEINLSRCSLLTNFYHLPRAMKLFVQENKNSIVPLAAEALFLDEIDKISLSYSSAHFLQRLESELGGLNPGI